MTKKIANKTKTYIHLTRKNRAINKAFTRFFDCYAANLTENFKRNHLWQLKFTPLL